MKNFNNLSKKLEKLQAQKKNFNSINDISLSQFIRYKKILSKEKQITKQMENTISLGNEINFWYDSSTKSWIENPNINCRKYYRLEKHAAYKKDLKLYKLGLSNKKTLPLIIQNTKNLLSTITNFISEIVKKLKPILSKYNFFKIFYQKYIYFKSQTLPKNINKLAINTATIGIKGYRHLKSNCRYIRNSISSKDSFKYIKNVINEANQKVDNYERQNYFRDSLKVENFKSNDINSNNSFSDKITSNSTNPTTHLSHNINKEIYEYSL